MYNVAELFVLTNKEELNDLTFNRIRICKPIFLTARGNELKLKDIFDNTIIQNPKNIQRLSVYYPPLSFKNGSLYKRKKELYNKLLEIQFTSLLEELDTTSIKKYLEYIGCYKDSNLYKEEQITLKKKI